VRLSSFSRAQALVEVSPGGVDAPARYVFFPAENDYGGAIDGEGSSCRAQPRAYV